MKDAYGEGAFPAFSGDPNNNEEYMNYSLNTNVAYAGKTIHVYVATFAGDFMSPQSEDYINFKINSWYKASAQNDEIRNISFAQGYSPSLVSYGMKQNNYKQSKLAEGFGPYIKNNIKLTVKDILNSGTCKITFDDYKTEAGKNTSNVKYIFTALSELVFANGINIQMTTILFLFTKIKKKALKK